MMYQQIKKIVKESMEGLHGRILFGTVSNLGPFSILVDQRFELPAEALLFSHHLQENKLEITIEGSKKEYIITEPLEVGDKVILIQLGEHYLVYDKVGDVYGTRTIT